LYTLYDHVWGIKITALEEYADFATLDTKKLFSKLKSHELSRKDHPNHDAYLTSKTFVTSTRVGGHVANPTNTTNSSTLEFVLSSLTAVSDKQYESISDNEIALLVRKFCTLHRFHKKRISQMASSSAMTPPTSSPTALSGRRSTPPINTTTTIGTTPATRARVRRSTVSGTRRRRSSRR
jgi:hypothetical protein